MEQNSKRVKECKIFFTLKRVDLPCSLGGLHRDIWGLVEPTKILNGLENHGFPFGWVTDFVRKRGL